ncbi:MAG: hypothetical protein ACTS10_08960 [Kiloniellales bacterium]
MPTHIKLLLSAIVIAAAAALGWWQLDIDQTVPGYVVWGLGAFMIVALWLFPEAKGEKQKGER